MGRGVSPDKSAHLPGSIQDRQSGKPHVDPLRGAGGHGLLPRRSPFLFLPALGCRPPRLRTLRSATLLIAPGSPCESILDSQHKKHRCKHSRAAEKVPQNRLSPRICCAKSDDKGRCARGEATGVGPCVAQGANQGKHAGCHEETEQACLEHARGGGVACASSCRLAPAHSGLAAPGLDRALPRHANHEQTETESTTVHTRLNEACRFPSFGRDPRCLPLGGSCGRSRCKFARCVVLSVMLICRNGGTYRAGFVTSEGAVTRKKGGTP